MGIRKHVPNCFTLINLICGALSILFVSQNSYSHISVLLVFAAALSDVFDGAAARALRVNNETGKQLDSLADVVSFGLAPTVIAYSMLKETVSADMQWLPLLSLVNVCCAALRLAKFNVSSDQQTDFRGMPSPANGILWAGIAAVAWETDRAFSIHSSLVLLVLLVITSLLMVSRVKMFSFKLKKGGWVANRMPYFYIITVVLFPFITWFCFGSWLLCIPFGVGWYLFLCVAWYFMGNREAQANMTETTRTGI